MSGLKWQKFYYSMIATPLRPADVVYGQLGFIAFRRDQHVRGVPGRDRRVRRAAIAARACWRLPVAVLVGMAVAGPVAAYATQTGERRRLRDDLPVRRGAGVPVLRGVLPGVPAARTGSSGSPTSARCGTGSSCPGPQPGHGRPRCRRSLNVALSAAWFVVGTWLAVRGFTAEAGQLMATLTAAAWLRCRCALGGAAAASSSATSCSTAGPGSSSCPASSSRCSTCCRSVSASPQLVGDFTLSDGTTIGYAAFVAPAMLASSAMNGAIFDSTYNIFFRMKYAKLYDAMLATPMRPWDVATGEVTWALLRGALLLGDVHRGDARRWGWSSRGGRCSRCRPRC